MPKRLLLNDEQAAALAGVEPAEVRRAHREGRLPRWRLPGTRNPVYDVRDVAACFGLPADALRALVVPEAVPADYGRAGK